MMLNYKNTCDLTEDDFINHEIRVWGFEKVESLLNSGFEPKLTSKGWTWIYTRVVILQGDTILNRLL